MQANLVGRRVRTEEDIVGDSDRGLRKRISSVTVIEDFATDVAMIDNLKIWRSRSRSSRLASAHPILIGQRQMKVE